MLPHARATGAGAGGARRRRLDRLRDRSSSCVTAELANLVQTLPYASTVALAAERVVYTATGGGVTATQVGPGGRQLWDVQFQTTSSWDLLSRRRRGTSTGRLQPTGCSFSSGRSLDDLPMLVVLGGGSPETSPQPPTSSVSVPAPASTDAPGSTAITVPSGGDALISMTDTDPTHLTSSSYESSDAVSSCGFSVTSADVDGFPVAMNGCATRQLRVSWRSLGDSLIAGYTTFLDPGMAVVPGNRSDPRHRR